MSYCWRRVPETISGAAGAPTGPASRRLRCPAHAGSRCPDRRPAGANPFLEGLPPGQLYSGPLDRPDGRKDTRGGSFRGGPTLERRQSPRTAGALRRGRRRTRPHTCIRRRETTPCGLDGGIIDELGRRVREDSRPRLSPTSSRTTGSIAQARRAQRAMEARRHSHAPVSSSRPASAARRWRWRRTSTRGSPIARPSEAIWCWPWAEGVVGDLAGFVAATYLRGMPFGQVPTSLLAMMGRGHRRQDGRRHAPMARTSWAPSISPGSCFQMCPFYRTLPRRELNSGWAEAIKTRSHPG